MADATQQGPRSRYSVADFHKLTNNRISSARSPDRFAGEPDTECTWATPDTRSLVPKRRSVPTQGRRPSTIRRQASYSSVKEDISGLAQSFRESPINSPTSQSRIEYEIDDPAGDKKPCECCCRCGRTRELLVDRQRGQRRSRSHSPLRTSVSELSGWVSGPLKSDHSVNVDIARVNHPGEAPLENLPAEILDQILIQLALDIPPREYGPRNADLGSCLLTSRTLYAATVVTLYSNVTVPHSFIFSKFLSQLFQRPALGTLVRRLDLSHFTSIGMGRTQQSNHEIQNLTSTTLLRCLDLIPNVQEVLFQEHVDEDIDEAVLRKLLFGLHNIQAIDFCAASSSQFINAFSASLAEPISSSSQVLSIRRLSLHECFTLHSSTIEKLLPRLPRLTHLDLSHTRVNDKALMSLPKSALLTHLNLGRCSQITGMGTVEFLRMHPAVTGLIYLNLSCDTSRYRLLWEADVTAVLQSLPSTLRSLNLSGAKIVSSHIPLLLPYTKYLEELSIGFAELSLGNINSLFLPQVSSDVEEEILAAENNWIPSTLQYLDLTGIQSVSQASLFGSSCILLSSVTSPLEVIEVGEKTIAALSKCSTTNKKLGWAVKELGRRGWYVREPTADDQVGLRGLRYWKMGAMWWGMRKIPVAIADVGGLYGHYMFKK